LDESQKVPEKVNCTYHILKGMEANELYIQLRKDIKTKVELHFPLEDAMMMVVKQLIDEDAK